MVVEKIQSLDYHQIFVYKIYDGKVYHQKNNMILGLQIYKLFVPSNYKKTQI